jgi:hypothetical protein
VTPERWSRIREVFGAALETPKSQRPQFLESACGDDPDLRAEVEGLLAGSEEPSWALRIGATILLMAKKKNPAAVALVRKGGKATARSLTPAQRSKMARNAATVRWGKK